MWYAVLDKYRFLLKTVFKSNRSQAVCRQPQGRGIARGREAC